MKTNPLAILWTGKATIYEYQDITDPNTFLSTQGEVPVVEDEPCRVSFSHDSVNQVVDSSEGVPKAIQVITLFIRPDLVINPGSIIEVTQNNRTTKYKGASVPSVYTNHQEIELELYEEHV